MFWIASAISFVIALVCLAGAVNAVMAQHRKRSGWVSTSGVVVDLQKRVFGSSRASGGVYCPTIEFRTITGAVVRFESSYGTMPASHRVGQALKIRYDPREPHAAEIDSIVSEWLAPGCFLAFAGLGLCFGVMFLGAQLLVSLSN